MKTQVSESSMDSNMMGATAQGLAQSKTKIDTHSVAESILDKAYPNGITERKKLLVIINPHGGSGNARHIYETIAKPMFEHAKCGLTVMETTHRFHALEIARDTPDLASKYDAIVCCSGDGIPHELVNGFSQRTFGDASKCLASLPICQMPCGSGNSMAISLNGNASPSVASLCVVKGKPMPVDLMLMTQGQESTLSFLTQSFGTIADADLGTEAFRFIGSTRFVLGTLLHTLKSKKYPCDLHVKYAHATKDAVKTHFDAHKAQKEGSISPVPSPNNSDDAQILETRFGRVSDPVPADWTHIPDGDNLSLFYAGKMPWVSADTMMFPATLPTDGTIDIFVTHTSELGPVDSVKMLLDIETGRHVHCKQAHYAKVLAYRLSPKKNKGYLSIDGEAFPHEPFQVEVKPGIGCLLSSSGQFAHTGF